MRIRFIIFFLTISYVAFSQNRPKIGLVLSGGGSKGIAHIGVLKVLESKGIKPDFIVGTSFGALVGGLYAIGYTPEEMEAIIKNNDWDYLLNDKIRRENLLIGQGDKNKKSLIRLPLDGLVPSLSSGLFSGQNILTFFEIKTREYNRDMSFNDLPIPFRCVATNIETGEAKIFDKGYIANAMRASMSIPSVFKPFEIDGNLYVDGGLVNNFPTDVAKQMGADIVIGVDVGAVLYKKDEITSIIRILDQTSSFYNYRVAQENKKLCDIYIRPNIDGLSAMSFDNTDDIIKRGIDATKSQLNKIDSIFGKYNLKPILNDSTTNKSKKINIDSIIVSTDLKHKKDTRGAKRLIDGKLNIKLPITLTEDELSQRINRLYGSKFFSDISMEFIPKDSAYIINLTTKEDHINGFNIGARYDQTYGVNILLGAQFRNLFMYGSLFELSVVAGQSPQVKLRYTTDRGYNIGFGSSFVYDNFYAYSYQNSVRYATYGFNRAAYDIFIHSYMGNYNRLIFGVQASAFGLSAKQSVSDIANISDGYLSPFLAYVVDTWDRAYYPNKGFKLKARADLIFDSELNNLPIAWARASLVTSISKKIKLITEGFLGFADNRLDTTLYRFQVGGMENNRIQWYNSFPGLQFLEHGSTNIWIVKVSPRYEFYKNNFLTLTFAATGMDNKPEDLFYKTENLYTGASIKYGFYSMFGPMEISADYSFNNYNKNYLISLGYWF